MPRRKSSAATTPASKKAHKRELSSTLTPSSRTSKRLKVSAENTPVNGKVTPKKSKYFEVSEEEEEPSSDEASESGYEDENADASATETSEPPTETEDDYDSEEEEEAKPKKKSSRKSTGAAGVVSAVIEGGKALWREGVKAGLGPGKAVFIEKPKPRGDGGVKYVPDRIHPNTMAFLADLKKNNDREWLKMHDPDYRQSWNNWKSFVEALSERIAVIVSTLEPLTLDVFAIFRDIHFYCRPETRELTRHCRMRPCQSFHQKIWCSGYIAISDSAMIQLHTSHTSQLRGLELGGRDHMPVTMCRYNLVAKASWDLDCGILKRLLCHDLDEASTGDHT
jgi:hypothetical protein